MKVLESRPVHTYPVIFENGDPRLSTSKTSRIFLKRLPRDDF